MEIKFKPNTVAILIGPTYSGKSTFCEKVQQEGKDQNLPVAIVSSDACRHKLLSDAENMIDRNSRLMLEVSRQAFDLLTAELKAFVEFPVTMPLVIVDTRGFDPVFRNQVIKIARDNGYFVDCVCFDYKTAAEYTYYSPESAKARILDDVQKFRRKVLPDLKRRDFDQFIRVRDPHFKDELDLILQDHSFGNMHLYLDDEEKSESFAVIGDTHECVDQLDEMISKLPADIGRIIHVGDYLDKGGFTSEMIHYMHKRVKEHDDMIVQGNHEAYLYCRLKGEIQAAPEDVEKTYFTALPILQGSEELRNKFFEIYEASHPFVHIMEISSDKNPASGRSFYVTHAPCDTKYLGKFSDQALRAQRNLFIKDRTEGDEREAMPFIFSQASPIEPIHIFGHMAHNGPVMYKNKVFLDTGCVHGGKLSAFVYQDGRYEIIQVDGVNTMPKDLRTDLSVPKKVVKPFDIRDYDLSPDDLKFLRRTMANGVKYISGTMAPAPSADGKLEPLEAAFEYFRKRGVELVNLQPKYMGSRGQLYLYKDPEKASFAVSRNGHVIRHVEGMEALVAKWFGNVNDWFEEKWSEIILDGEILPWSALGKSLINNEFRTYEALVWNELKALDQDEVFKGFDIGGKHDLPGRLKDIEVFSDTLALYSQPTDLEFRGFNVLSVDGKPFPFEASVAFQVVNPDTELTVNLNHQTSVERAIKFFEQITVERGMEGVVVKPLGLDRTKPIDMPEYMKVRNESYLTLIYGYDYKRRYEKMVNTKNITGKVRVSIDESNIGLAMLTASDDERAEFIVRMISQLKKEQVLDPRL
jgi:predicted kinase/uncharacterized pyridoxamine 5'-phosphate oxidase family protein